MISVYTVGHSRHAASRFLELCRQHGVACVADVRSRPYSRWAPHFGKDALARLLTGEGIAYVFLGQELGGRPEGERFTRADGSLDVDRRAQAPDFQAGMERLVALAVGGRTVIMCAEEDPARCHRRLLVAPALAARGVRVIDIRGDGRLEGPDRRDPEGQLLLFA